MSGYPDTSLRRLSYSGLSHLSRRSFSYPPLCLSFSYLAIFFQISNFSMILALILLISWSACLYRSSTTYGSLAGAFESGINCASVATSRSEAQSRPEGAADTESIGRCPRRFFADPFAIFQKKNRTLFRQLLCALRDERMLRVTQEGDCP